jgi:hypothetical protein
VGKHTQAIDNKTPPVRCGAAAATCRQRRLLHTRTHAGRTTDAVASVRTASDVLAAPCVFCALSPLARIIDLRVLRLCCAQRFCGKLDPSAIVAGIAPFARFRLVRATVHGAAQSACCAPSLLRSASKFTTAYSLAAVLRARRRT